MQNAATDNTGKRARLGSNKTFFTKTGIGPDLTHLMYFTSLCAKSRNQRCGLSPPRAPRSQPLHLAPLWQGKNVQPYRDGVVCPLSVWWCAGKHCNKCTLSKPAFLTFVNTELAAFIKNQKDPSVLDCMMKKLDINCDGQLAFQESLNLIGSMVVACHDPFTRSQKYIRGALRAGLWTHTFPSGLPITIVSSQTTYALSLAHPPPHAGHSCW